jgi:hypothetical protein
MIPNARQAKSELAKRQIEAWFSLVMGCPSFEKKTAGPLRVGGCGR